MSLKELEAGIPQGSQGVLAGRSRGWCGRNLELLSAGGQLPVGLEPVTCGRGVQGALPRFRVAVGGSRSLCEPGLKPAAQGGCGASIGLQPVGAVISESSAWKQSLSWGFSSRCPQKVGGQREGSEE